MTIKRKADVNVYVNLNVNLNICWTLVTWHTHVRTHAHMDVTSWQNAKCPLLPLAGGGHKKSCLLQLCIVLSGLKGLLFNPQCM